MFKIVIYFCPLVLVLHKNEVKAKQSRAYNLYAKKKYEFI